MEVLLSDRRRRRQRPRVAATRAAAVYEDFSLIADRQIKELPLWNEYLVYATLFGIADKVCSDFSDVYPDYFNMNRMAGTMLHLVGNNSLYSYASAAVNGMEMNASRR